MIHNITDRDDDAVRMKACWKKMNNFLHTFAVDYFRVEKEFANGQYGSDWSFRRWLLLKAGVSERSVLALLKTRENAFASEERDAAKSRADMIRQEKHAEWQQRQKTKAAIAAEKAAARERAAAAIAEKQKQRELKTMEKKRERRSAAARKAARTRKKSNRHQAQREQNDRAGSIVNGYAC